MSFSYAFLQDSVKCITTISSRPEREDYVWLYVPNMVSSRLLLQETLLMYVMLPKPVSVLTLFDYYKCPSYVLHTLSRSWNIFFGIVVSVEDIFIWTFKTFLAVHNKFEEWNWKGIEFIFIYKPLGNYCLT